MVKTKKNREVQRREVLWLLLSGLGFLGGCSTPSGYKPSLPESCVWMKFPYTWMCIDPNEGLPVPEKETLMWDSVPLSEADLEMQHWLDFPSWEMLGSCYNSIGERTQ